MFLQSSLDVFQVTMLSKCFSIHHEAGKPCVKERCEKCICVSRHFKQQLVSLFNQVSRLIFDLKSFQLSVCKISLIKYENWIKLKETLYFFLRVCTIQNTKVKASLFSVNKHDEVTVILP